LGGGEKKKKGQKAKTQLHVVGAFGEKERINKTLLEREKGPTKAIKAKTRRRAGQHTFMMKTPSGLLLSERVAECEEVGLIKEDRREIRNY